MKIKKFKARNFRNIESCDISFSEGVNFIYGNNAQGKTNAVEGIYIFARGKSFRANDDSELVKFGTDGFHIFIEYEDKKGINSLEYSLFGKEKRRKKNGYKIDKVKEMIGNFKAVMFYPDDLLLVKDTPELRRSFLNVAISQCYDRYISCYSNYKKALENRNCLLKFASKGMFVDENELISWSYYMAEYASYIYVMRKEYIKKLEVYSKAIMIDISDGKEELELLYKSDVKSDTDDRKEAEEEYRKIFTSEMERERACGTSLFGIQRDDIVININGKSARNFASQGQQRSIVLALKLGEGEVNRDICGEYPVFLFDDVLSELDEKRRDFVLRGVGERQIIITSCEKEEKKISGKKIEVNNGCYN
ncbi:MAG: DNA replication/repair protein RecF [Ruminococcaceae bacterium]|nr:DNA replication/repair protein RecF [Oscillospiraceae bacterium]